MGNSLVKAVELARKLPETDQEALGELLIAEMRSEERWADLFKTSQDKFAELADQALAEHKAGKTRPWN